MSPLQMAKEQCANLCKDGSCLGIPVECLQSSPNRKPVAAPLDQCRLAKRGQRCRYFEEVVAPLANHYPDKYAGAVEDYSAGRAKNALKVKAVRQCECGAALAKRKRMCPTCAKRKRRSAARNGMAQNRRNAVSS